MKEFYRILVAHILILGLVLGVEIFLRQVKYAQAHLAHPPGSVVFDRDKFDIGLDGSAKFTVSSLGLRGEEPRAKAYKILVTGSSGALNWMLADREAWPSLLAEALRASKGDVWTGNAARPGNRVVECAVQLEELLGRGLKPDLVLVVATGIELLSKYYQGDLYRATDLTVESERAEVLGRAFAVSRGPFSWRNPAIVAWIRDNGNELEAKVVPPADYFAKARALRKQATRLIDGEPELSEVFKEVDAALGRISELGRRHGVRVVILTRPTLWREEMSPQERDLLWLGQAGRNEKKFPGNEASTEYYSHRVLARTMAAYNRHVLDGCATSGSECWDLSAAIPKNAENFFDDSHLTPKGAALAAKFLVGRLGPL